MKAITLLGREAAFSSNNMREKKYAFESYTIKQWQTLVESSLKGCSFQDLHTNTYEGLTLQPLYTQQPTTPDNHPSRWWSKSDSWYVAQQVTADTTSIIQKRVEEELSKGSDVIALKNTGDTTTWSKDELDQLLSLQESPHIFINDERMLEKWCPLLVELKENHQVKGVFGYDFISQEALKGQFLNEEKLSQWVIQLNEFSLAQPDVKSIVISTVPYHQSGANAVQELASALAEAAWIINHLTQKGWKVEEIVRRMHIQFATGSTFFLEIAKLRAFRALWTHFIGCYGVVDHPVSVGSESSPLNKTVQDPHVNILRSGNEAFAAALGGVNYQHVEPFNATYEKPLALSTRIARNLQLILKEEVFLKGLSDPGGGSFYIESLTKQLSEQAWSYFLQIEEQGGVQEALTKGWLQQEIDQIWTLRKQDSATRKTTLVGTNRYAPYEKIDIEGQDESNLSSAIPPLVRRTIGQEWEQLVAKVQHKQASHSLPVIELICLGLLKEYKPRADFIQGLLSTVGLKSKITNQLGTSPVQIVCGTNQAYEQSVQGLLSTKAQNQHLYLAGKPKKDQFIAWTDAGLAGTVYEGKDMILFLVDLLKQLEEVNSSETVV
ncbi:methylmalonyl-CoA mutase family protein [Jeotgalibacillus marinus]|uniref:Methylmalonyl-CoA mutase family protein n=1 Tax=Jeotgalibacillus marinus TaxID=86667 RepID=A0ABV3PZ37_9BACL